MKKLTLAFGVGCACAVRLNAEPALTIYNQNFAVVRDSVPLTLKAGINTVRFGNATAHVEPDSVILRDVEGKRPLQILEQNYRNDPVSQELLLSMFEGKTVEFESVRHVKGDDTSELIPGKVIRSGYVPGGGSEQPIIEVNGKLQFYLPGRPQFPSLGEDTILKPSFNWLLQTDTDGKVDAEVGYVTTGFTWEADYNLVSPEHGDLVDMVGWITMGNHSGKTFENARIKLMAGDVNKIQPAQTRNYRMQLMEKSASMVSDRLGVTEKSFDDFHLYSIERPTTLHDRETKQVEFIQATGVKAPAIYIYDGAAGYRFYGGFNDSRDYGTGSNKKVAIYREFVNSETNQLGIALPKGRLRFYRRDEDGQLEFVGENTIDHTPRNETLRVSTGNSFDLVGERKQLDFAIHQVPVTQTSPAVGQGSKKNMTVVDESFEIKLRNRKKEPVNIKVVEHLYRWSNWNIQKNSDDFKKTDSQTIEFDVPVQPDQEKVITYKVQYSY
jgi:hypothetical protein